MVNLIQSSSVNETFEDAPFKLSHDHLLLSTQVFLEPYAVKLFPVSSHFLSCFNAHLCHISKSSSLWNQISVFSSALRWFGHISVLPSCVLQSRIPDMLPDFVDFIFILLKLASCFSTCLPLCLAFESLLAKHPQCSQSFVAPIPTGLKCAAAIKFKISKYEEKSA